MASAKKNKRVAPNSEVETDQLALRVSQAVAVSIASPEPKRLRERLQDLAEVLVGLPGIRAASVVAFDEDEDPLTYGRHCLEPSDTGPDLDAVFELRQDFARQLATEQPFFVKIRNKPTWVLPLLGWSRVLGLVLAELDLIVSETSLHAIAKSAPILAAAIRSSIHLQAWSRIEQLQRLAWEMVGQQPWNFGKLVNELSAEFDAGAVTMFLKDQQELRLAASTDTLLSKKKSVIYLPGEGLTGYVFQSGKALRLRNTKDREEIRRVTGLERTGPVHPERDREGSFTGQFLGVPLRFGSQVIGVLRMSRKSGNTRFTLEDEKALQFFADLLGAALAPAWDLLLKRSVLESVTEGILITRRVRGADGNPFYQIITANAGAEKLLGRSRQDIEGYDAREIYAPGEYERIWKELGPHFKRVYKEGHVDFGPIPSRIRQTDGTVLPVTISYRLLMNDLVRPPTQYTIGIARDTSESERQAGQHLRMLELLDTMKIAYFRADLEGKTLESTPTDCEITGYPAEELKRFSRHILYQASGDRDHLLKRARENQGRLLREIAQMRRKSGELFWAEGDLRILRDSEGREIGSEGFYRDVSERIDLQHWLNEDTARVLSDDELFERLKRDAEFNLHYISSVSHQLQTPLGSLVETLRNFERGELGQKELVSRLPYVIGQAVVCTRLVRNLSYMDKILRGESFSSEKVQLRKLAVETKWDFIHLLKDLRFELYIDIDSLDDVDRRFPVYGHRELLRQVLINLVDNAIKYSFSGTAIQVRGGERSGSSYVEITNKGLPISEPEREQVFRRGFRTPNAHALIPHGTGLGLWLVRKILDAHNATIRCLEVVEGGQKRNCFRITFPGPGAGPRRSS